MFLCCRSLGDKVFFRGAVSKDGYMVYNADGTMTNDFDVVLGDYYANPPDIYEIVKFITGPQTTNRGNIVLYIFGCVWSDRLFKVLYASS